MTAIHIIEKRSPNEERPEFGDPEIQPFLDTLKQNGVCTVETIERTRYESTPGFHWFKVEWK